MPIAFFLVKTSVYPGYTRAIAVYRGTQKTQVPALNKIIPGVHFCIRNYISDRRSQPVLSGHSLSAGART